MKILIAVGFGLIPVYMQVALGEPPTPQQPRPGPEVGKLAYYLGTSRGEGAAKASPFQPGGKLTSTTSCEWFAGGFHPVCRGEEPRAHPHGTFPNIRGYDEKTQGYTEYSSSDLGESEYSTGDTIVGNERTFVFDMDMEGRPAKLRYVEVPSSPTPYTYRAEASIDGGPWMTIAVGKVTKVG